MWRTFPDWFRDEVEEGGEEIQSTRQMRLAIVEFEDGGGVPSVNSADCRSWEPTSDYSQQEMVTWFYNHKELNGADNLNEQRNGFSHRVSKKEFSRYLDFSPSKLLSDF